MPSKSRQIVRAAFSGGLPRHPAIASPDSLVALRLGSEEPLRLPDVENSPSAATVLRSEYTIGSDAAGNAVWAENYSFNASRIGWVVTTGITAATPNFVAHPQTAAFNTEARVSRMISYKISVIYIGTSQLSSGYLSFSEKTAIADVNSQPMDQLHTGSAAQVAATDGLICYVDYVQPPRYEGPVAEHSQNTFPLALFAASGLPASTPSLFRVRVCRFMEYLPVEGALAEGELMHEPSNPASLAAHGELSGNATSITTHARIEEFGKLVRNVANAAYHIASPLAPYVVPKARQYLMASLMGTKMLL